MQPVVNSTDRKRHVVDSTHRTQGTPGDYYYNLDVTRGRVKVVHARVANQPDGPINLYVTVGSMSFCHIKTGGANGGCAHFQLEKVGTDYILANFDQYNIVSMGPRTYVRLQDADLKIYEPNCEWSFTLEEIAP